MFSALSNLDCTTILTRWLQDRDEISWTGNQLDLISQLSNMSKPLIVVQLGTQVDSSSLVSNANINSLLWAGYPGQDGGVAIFNILGGKIAPAGRLPVTQYQGSYVNDVPMTNMSLAPYSSNNYTFNNPGRTYKFFTGKPVFEFGFGLHYTNFTAEIDAPPQKKYDISALLKSKTTAKYKDQIPFLNIPVKVNNTGFVSSDYVVLGFLSFRNSTSFSPPTTPQKSLVAYQRLHDLSPGSEDTVSLPLNLGSLSQVDERGYVVVYPGTYTFKIDIDDRSVWTFELVGEAVVLDEWPESKVPWEGYQAIYGEYKN